jgi:ketosteroid isomerase-like protein
MHKWVDAFNKGDASALTAVCADSGVVLDELPPYVWQGSGACASWYKAFQAFTAQQGMTNPKATVGKVRHSDVDSSHAYLVAPATFSYTKDGKVAKESAIVTMTLQKGDSGWRITGSIYSAL